MLCYTSNTAPIQTNPSQGVALATCVSECDVRQTHKDSGNLDHCVTLRFNNLSLVKHAIMSPLKVVR